MKRPLHFCKWSWVKNRSKHILHLWKPWMKRQGILRPPKHRVWGPSVYLLKRLKYGSCQLLAKERFTEKHSKWPKNETNPWFSLFWPSALNLWTLKRQQLFGCTSNFKAERNLLKHLKALAFEAFRAMTELQALELLGNLPWMTRGAPERNPNRQNLQAP